MLSLAPVPVAPAVLLILAVGSGAVAVLLNGTAGGAGRRGGK